MLCLVSGFVAVREEYSTCHVPGREMGILDKLLLVNFPLRQKLLNCLLRPYIACFMSLYYLVYLYFSEVQNIFIICFCFLQLSCKLVIYSLKRAPPLLAFVHFGLCVFAAVVFIAYFITGKMSKFLIGLFAVTVNQSDNI